MRIALLRGRYLTTDDAAASPASVVVNAAFARRFFPATDPIGQLFSAGSTTYQVVGVVADMHRQGLEQAAIPEYFESYVPRAGGRVDFVLRATTDVSFSTLPSSIKQLVRSMLPGTIVESPAAARELLAEFESRRVLETWLLAAFAALALTLSVVGIYGVVQYSVSQRRREIGVRMALGATSGDILRTVVLRGMRAPAVGMATGIVASVAMTRLMSHLLFETSPFDATTYATVTVLLSSAAFLACCLPARRAARVDPNVVMRTS
jgi:hypothetical protein